MENSVIRKCTPDTICAWLIKSNNNKALYLGNVYHHPIWRQTCKAQVLAALTNRASFRLLTAHHIHHSPTQG